MGRVFRVVDEGGLPGQQVAPAPPRVRREKDPVLLPARFRERPLGDRIADLTTARLCASRVTSRSMTGTSEAFGQIERLARHVVGFLLVPGLEADDAREVGQDPAVLLVLRAVHAGVVRDGDDEAAVDRHERRIRRTDRPPRSGPRASWPRAIVVRPAKPRAPARRRSSRSRTTRRAVRRGRWCRPSAAGCTRGSRSKACPGRRTRR